LKPRACGFPLASAIESWLGRGRSFDFFPCVPCVPLWLVCSRPIVIPFSAFR
jgi:hypothetical protein